MDKRPHENPLIQAVNEGMRDNEGRLQEINKPSTTGTREYHKTDKLDSMYKNAISNRQDSIFQFNNLEQNYGQVSRAQPQYKPKPEHGSFVRFQNDLMTDSWGKLLDPRAYSRDIQNETKYHETERPVYGT